MDRSTSASEEVDLRRGQEGSAAVADGRATGYRLAKTLGVVAIMASAVSQEYGSGINFVLTKSLVPYPGIGSLVPWAMLVAGLFLLPNVMMFSRFAAVMPRAGSTYVWLTRSVGMPVGFVVAFLWFVGVVAAMGFLAFSFPTFVQDFLTTAGVATKWPVSTAGHLILGLGLIWAVFALHYSGIKNYGRIIVLLFGLVLFAAAATIIIGFSSSQETFLSAVTQQTGQSLQPKPAQGSSHFLAVVTLFVFSYGGLAAATSLGGEAKDATRSIGRGVWYAWGIALVLYTLVSFSLFHVVPAWAVPQLASSGHSALATTPGLISLMAPRTIGLIIDAVVVIIIAKTVAPEMLDCSRYLFAWAQDRLMPSALLHTNRHHAPDVALLISAILGSLFLVEATFYGFEIGVVIRSMSLVLVFGVLGIGILNLRFNPRMAALPWARAVAGHASVLVAAVAGIIIAIALERSVLVVPGKSFWVQPSVQAVIALIVAAGLYLWARQRSIAAGEPLAAGEPPTE